jgi:NADH:ubiquinone oxidoreductase subunit F (NADH-binding)
MTSTLHAPTRPMPASAIGTPRLLAGLDIVDVLDLRGHVATHGPLPATDLGHLLGMLDQTAVAGRGGAGFDLACKIRALRKAKHVVVNGCESEPGSFKDRTLLRRTPHLVIDGAVSVARAVRVRRVSIAVHDTVIAASLRQAVNERNDGVEIRVRLVEGGFVSGEAHAVLRAIDGGPALPSGRREHATESGVLLSNAETMAQLAVLLRMGPQRFAASGTRAEPGTTLLSVSGAVERPGVIEIPIGTPLGIVLQSVGAAPAQAVIIGGYHGTWHAPLPNILLSRAGVAAAGGSFGAGVVIVLDENTCALGELARVAHWLAGESARQCGPCMFGLPALAKDVDAIMHGSAAGIAAAFAHGRSVTGRGACAHPDGSARFVGSALHLLRDETERHLAGGCGRPVLNELVIA